MPSTVLIAGELERHVSLPLESTQLQEIKYTEGFLPFSRPGAGEGGWRRGERAQESWGVGIHGSGFAQVLYSYQLGLACALPPFTLDCWGQGELPHICGLLVVAGGLAVS